MHGVPLRRQPSYEGDVLYTTKSGATSSTRATGKVSDEVPDRNNVGGLAAVSGSKRSLTLSPTAAWRATGYARKDGDDAHSI